MLIEYRVNTQKSLPMNVASSIALRRGCKITIKHNRNSPFPSRQRRLSHYLNQQCVHQVFCLWWEEIIMLFFCFFYQGYLLFVLILLVVYSGRNVGQGVVSLMRILLGSVSFLLFVFIRRFIYGGKVDSSFSFFLSEAIFYLY